MSLHEVFGEGSRVMDRSRGDRNGSVDGATPLIALIDDDDDLCEVLATRLSRAGHRVVRYRDAESALAEMDAGRRPDLILLDLFLPGMDGWQFRLAQKQRAALIDVPVVALSGDSSPVAAAIDAAAYLSKPAEFDHLRTVIDHVLLATERRRLSAKAVELERMRSLGTLVASLAHEINNPLTSVVGNLERAVRFCVQSGESAVVEQLTPLLDRAQEGAQRVAFVVQLLSTFGESGGDSIRPSDPLRALDAATRLAAHHMEGRAHLVAHVEPVPFVCVQEGRLAQVILDLLLNAAHSILPGKPDENEIRVRVWSEPPEVAIEVEDTGCGIAPEVASRIFEPFYSTKPAGTGVGLGLSISRDLIHRFGGSISVRSELGRGSTFRVVLPAYAGLHATQ